MNIKYTKELIELMEENPELPVKAQVSAKDCNDSWWLGNLDIDSPPYIDEIAFIDGELCFKSDDNYIEWCEQLFHELPNVEDVSDEELYDFCKNVVDKEVKWEKCILICVID